MTDRTINGISVANYLMLVRNGLFVGLANIVLGRGFWPINSMLLMLWVFLRNPIILYFLYGTAMFSFVAGFTKYFKTTYKRITMFRVQNLKR